MKTYVWHYLLTFLLILPVLNPPAFTNYGEQDRHIPVDTIIASLRSNQNDYYLFRGEPAGYHMELIRAFAQSAGKPYRIQVEADINKRWEELLNNKVNIVVSSSEDDNVLHHYEQEIFKSLPLEKNTHSVWVVAQHNRRLLEALNVWIAHYRATMEYATQQQTYFVARINFPLRTSYSSLSPYDHLIRQYAERIGWDWRLLASIVYQESKFRADAQSYRGAYGLMQITPSTAEFLKVDDIEDPQHNLEAGTSLLRYLQRNIPLDSVSSVDSIRFVLAAYNAGLNRLKDCRQFTLSQGKNPNAWDDVASVIPLMKHPVFYDSDDIQLGRFKGLETLNYVDRVMDRYDHYKVLVNP